MLLLLENMKPIKTKVIIKTTSLFKMMNITEQQFKQAKAWYESANQSSLTNHQNHAPTSFPL